jgi:hypothetical protein
MCLGLIYKKGKFSAIEEQQLKHAVENYRIVSRNIFLCSFLCKLLEAQTIGP